MIENKTRKNFRYYFEKNHINKRKNKFQMKHQRIIIRNQMKILWLLLMRQITNIYRLEMQRIFN